MERWIHYFCDSPAANLVGNKVLHDAFRVCAAGSQTGQVFDSATNLIAEVLHVYPRYPLSLLLLLWALLLVWWRLWPIYSLGVALVHVHSRPSTRNVGHTGLLAR